MDAGNGFMTWEELVDSAYETVALSDESYPAQRAWKKKWMESARRIIYPSKEIPKPSCSMTECIAGIREVIGKEKVERVEYDTTYNPLTVFQRIERLERIIERLGTALRSESAQENAL